MTIDSEGPTIGDVEPPTSFDLAEFEALYRRVTPRLLRYVMLKGMTRADAEEVVAETWLVTWKKVNTPVPPDRVAYIYGIARKVFQRMRASNRRRAWEPLPPGNRGPSVPDVSGAVDDYLVLKQRLEAIDLPDRQLDAYVLREYCGFTRKRVAQAMGITEDTVATHLRRARAKVAAFQEKIAALRKRKEQA